MIDKKNFFVRLLTSIVCIIYVIFSLIYNKLSFYCFFIIVVSITLIEWITLNSKNNKINKPVIFLITGLFILISFLLFLILFIYDENSPNILMWVLFLTWGTDIGSYIFGSILKGPLFFPNISPKKTWSGFWLGIISGSLISSFIIQNSFISNNHSIWIHLIGFLLTVCAQFGDLCESRLKRYLNVKDSGYLIPGHGGILDRIDSSLFTVFLTGLIFIFNKFTLKF